MKEKPDEENEQNKNLVNYIDMIKKFGIPTVWRETLTGGNVGEFWRIVCDSPN